MLLLLGFFLDLRRNGGRVSPELVEHVLNDLLLGCSPEQVDRVDVQVSPLHRVLGGALEQLARSVAEVLGDVDLLGGAARPCGGGRTGPCTRAAPAEGAVTEEVGEELVEEAAPPTEGRARSRTAPTLELSQVLFADGDRALLAVLGDPHGCYGRADPVDLAHRGGHRSETSSQRASRHARTGQQGPP